MTRALLKKCVHESKWLLLSCMTVLFAFCWLRVWIVSQIETERFKSLLELIPLEWQRFTSVDFTYLITYTGRISLVYDELIVIVCVAIWAISRGSDCVSGEVGRGTMEMLLAQPYSRTKVLLTHASVTVGGLLLLAVTAWSGTAVGLNVTTVVEQHRPAIILPIELPGLGSRIPIPFAKPEVRRTRMSEKVDPHVFWPATVNLVALGLMIAGFSTLMSSWDRYRWRTIGIVVGTCMVQVIIKIAGLAADRTEWLLYLTALTAYEPEQFVYLADSSPHLAWQFFLTNEQGQWIGYGPLWYDAILVTIGLISYAGAAIIFCRRDLPAPL
ncbi:MAG: ABC transporter permease subunit [Pirellulaceae bacterium]